MCTPVTNGFCMQKKLYSLRGYLYVYKLQEEKKCHFLYIFQTVRLLLKPSADWGPALEGHKQEQKRLQQTLTLRHATDSQVPLNPNHSLHSTEDEEEEEEKIIGEKAPSIPICVVQNETKI